MGKEMTIPPKRQLAVARWRYPEYEWHVMPDGRVFTRLLTEPNQVQFFNLGNQEIQTAIITKLSRDHNIRIEKKKHEWVAVDHKQGEGWQMTGDHEHADLAELLVQTVERIVEGGE